MGHGAHIGLRYLTMQLQISQTIFRLFNLRVRLRSYSKLNILSSKPTQTYLIFSTRFPTFTDMQL